MIKEKQNTQDLIDALTDDLIKVKVMPHPFWRALPWFLSAVIYMVFAVFILGLRSDIEIKISQASFIFELLYVFAIALSAALCSSWLCVPDIRGRKWIIALPLSLLLVAILWSFVSCDKDIYNIINLHLHHCHLNAIILGTIPTFVILFFSIRGKTTHPYIMSLMNILSIGAIGYIGLRLTCLSDNAMHLSFAHVLPYLLLGIVIAALGRRIYRW